LYVTVAVAAMTIPISSTPSVTAADTAATVIARYRERIPGLMAEQDLPGLAVALVDGDTVLWTEGFGSTDRDGQVPITPDTMFSVQSTSKTFTATAVMLAVQDGRLDLDKPITTYLPDFTVHSAFEDHPERRITLRMLLSHTAGFTHEAPVGNNYELDPGEFDAHVRSISETWLRFPVGTGYAYSNLGIDLAAAILERVLGEPFPEVMRDSVLAPLGMDHSTFDRARIRATSDRAIGHVALLNDVPVDVPMMAAGGLYASAADMARFLRFQLIGGAIDGTMILEPALMDEMRTIPAPYAGASAGYALGVARTRWRAGRNADLFSHAGGGFGFLADLWWLPQLQLGISVLTNSSDHDLQGDLALSILRDLVNEPGGVHRERLLALPDQGGPNEPDGPYQAPAGMRALVADAAQPLTGDQSSRWAAYAGPYRLFTFGATDPTAPPERFLVDSGVPRFETNETGSVIRHTMTEVETGLFLANNGETLDLRDSTPTWRNLDLVRAADGPGPWQWVVLASVPFLVVALLVAAVVRRIRRRSTDEAGTAEPAARRRWRRIAWAIAGLASIMALGMMGLIAAAPGLVDSGFLGWVNFPLPMRLALHLPLALALVTGALTVLAVLGWTRRWWSRELQLTYGIVAIASVALVAQLAAWRLIGWGLT
jgi:CubicO group peptidase (beta-lactamase class C family)